MILFLFSLILSQESNAKSIRKVQMYSTKGICRMIVVGDTSIEDFTQKNIPNFGNSSAKFILLVRNFSTENQFSSDINIDGIRHLDVKNQEDDIQITIDLEQFRAGKITSITPELLIIDLAANKDDIDKSQNDIGISYDDIPSKEEILEEYIELGLISDQYKSDSKKNDSDSKDVVDDVLMKTNTPRVVIDAGHGGKSHPGAQGSTGLREADIALEISNILAQKLEQENIQVVLTRETDEFVSLQQRVKIANTSRADLFISIHINAATVDWMRGFEVYTVATDKNSTHTISNHHKNMIVQQRSNKDILQSLAYSNPNQNSIEFANLALEQILEDLEKRYPDEKFVNHGHKTAMFTVLVGTTMPAILMESSFISNPEEERWLRSSYYKQSIANSLYTSIIEYFSKSTEDTK